MYNYTNSSERILLEIQLFSSSKNEKYNLKLKKKKHETRIK